MNWLALFGWVCFAGLGLWALAAGLFTAYVEATFGGRPSPIGFIIAAVGALILVAAIHVSPIHISWALPHDH